MIQKIGCDNAELVNKNTQYIQQLSNENQEFCSIIEDGDVVSAKNTKRQYILNQVLYNQSVIDFKDSENILQRLQGQYKEYQEFILLMYGQKRKQSLKDVYYIEYMIQNIEQTKQNLLQPLFNQQEYKVIQINPEIYSIEQNQNNFINYIRQIDNQFSIFDYQQKICFKSDMLIQINKAIESAQDIIYQQEAQNQNIVEKQLNKLLKVTIKKIQSTKFDQFKNIQEKLNHLIFYQYSQSNISKKLLETNINYFHQFDPLFTLDTKFSQFQKSGQKSGQNKLNIIIKEVIYQTNLTVKNIQHQIQQLQAQSKLQSSILNSVKQDQPQLYCSLLATQQDQFSYGNKSIETVQQQKLKFSIQLQTQLLGLASQNGKDINQKDFEQLFELFM